MGEDHEVALFIDFENVRYGLLNTYGQEPDPHELMRKARTYGRVAVASAYADFTEHPSYYRRTLEVAGILPRDIAKRRTGSHKSSADMVMLMDIVDCLLDRPSVDTYILMTGDSDFIRVVTRARHRFGKRVIISAVPGTVSNDLVASADAEDLIVIEGADVHSTRGDTDQALLPEGTTYEEAQLIRLIDYLEQNRPYLTLNFIHSYAISPTGRLRLTDDTASRILDRFMDQQILIPYDRELEDGRIVTNLHINREHFVCDQVLNGKPADE
ncbi:MAG: NYN domain-containing protein [Anaerolineae bacterium]